MSKVSTGAVAIVVAATALATGAAASPSVGAPPVAQPDGRVSAIAVDAANGVVYIGGSFRHVADRRSGTQTRNRLAALRMTDGSLLPWAPGADNTVEALTLVNGTLYVGGAFSSVTGSGSAVAGSRSRLAAIDATTGAVQSWNPGASATVNALSASSTRLYVGGSFTSIGGADRARLAAFLVGPTSAGQLDPLWTPKASGPVLGLTYSPVLQRLYVGGQFTTVNGAARPYGVAVAPDSGAVDPAFISPGYKLYQFAADASGVYAGGGGNGGHLVAWNTDGSLRHEYQTDGGVESVAVFNGEVYAGGHFQNYCLGDTGAGSPYVCSQPLRRMKLMSVDASGTVSAWNPTANSPLGVWSLSVDSAGTIYAGGDFTKINGQAQAHYAEFPPAG